MGRLIQHPPVKLFIGLISNDIYLFEEIAKVLAKRFGSIDLKSPYFDFTHTEYYTDEFGKNLLRQFITFKKFIQPQHLVQIKILTNKIEKKYSKDGNRRINIDPGYLDLGKVILATTKDYSHRIFLKNGIYAEVTLYFKKDGFLAWPWTYPDYRSSEYIDFFNKLRKLYHDQIRHAR